MGLQSVTRKAERAQPVDGSLSAIRSAIAAELEKVFAVTPEDVKRVARQYLGPNRIELDIVPGAPAHAAGRSCRRPVEAGAGCGGPKLAEIKDTFDRSIMPRLGPTPHFVPPGFERRRLSNGLELLIVERHELPIVTVDLIVKSGETSTPPGKEGLASLAASLLDEGTKSRTRCKWPASWPRSARPSARRATWNRRRQPDHPHAAPGARPRPVRRRHPEPVVPREGAGTAQAPAAGPPQGPRRRPRADRRGGFPAADLWAGPSLWPPGRGDARLGPVDHP